MSLYVAPGQRIETNRDPHTNTEVRIRFLRHLKVDPQAICRHEFEHRIAGYDPLTGIARLATDRAGKRCFQHVTFEHRSRLGHVGFAAFDRRRLDVELGFARE